MNALWRRLVQQLGGLALASLALLGAGVVFHAGAIGPLEARSEQLDRQLARHARRTAGEQLASAATPAAKLAAFYRFFDRQEDAVEWLAVLHLAAKSVGVEMRVAEYKLVKTSGRLHQYRITMPLSGNSAQIRAFLENALNEIPVLSLDQVNLRRQRVADVRAEAEAVLTLHLLKP